MENSIIIIMKILRSHIKSVSYYGSPILHLDVVFHIYKVGREFEDVVVDEFLLISFIKKSPPELRRSHNT